MVTILRATRGLLAATALVVLAACSSPEERAQQHFERAIEHVEAGDDAKAMVEFRNVLQIEPKNAEVLYQLGRLHTRAEAAGLPLRILD